MIQQRYWSIILKPKASALHILLVHGHIFRRKEIILHAVDRKMEGGKKKISRYKLANSNSVRKGRHPHVAEYN